MWNRVLFSERDAYVKKFDVTSVWPDYLAYPGGLDISASKNLFIADRGNGRVLVAKFDPSAQSLTTKGTMFDMNLTVSVADVAWDGQDLPITTDFVYVLASLGKVSYWLWLGASGQLQWEYGSEGSGVGQFVRPAGICVGRQTSTNGQSIFTNNFYVADEGNQRVVWLQRTGSGAIWKSSRAIPDGGIPKDCAVDHFGNVYVADTVNSRVIKYSWDLANEFARYGTYGTGETNLNTFAHPQSISFPFGLKSVNGVVVWYADGRMVTSEDWSPTSGGVEHWLGIEIPSAIGWGGAFGASTDYRTTDHGYITVDVMAGQPVSGAPKYKTLLVNSFKSPGWINTAWDGTSPSGRNAPEGWYHFRISAVSAYGCDGSKWCATSVNTNSFRWNGGCVDPEACAPLELNVALPVDGDVTVETLPVSYRLGQVISDYVGPVFRVQGSESVQSAAGRSMTDREAVRSVRRSGIRALSMDVPGGENAVRVRVYIYALNGRLVRRLMDETLDAGRFVVGWDGLDETGRRVLSGVYIAVMSSGSFRGRQRLIIK